MQHLPRSEPPYDTPLVYFAPPLSSLQTFQSTNFASRNTCTFVIAMLASFPDHFIPRARVVYGPTDSATFPQLRTAAGEVLNWPIHDGKKSRRARLHLRMLALLGCSFGWRGVRWIRRCRGRLLCECRRGATASISIVDVEGF